MEGGRGGRQKKVRAPARTNDVTRGVGEKSPNSEAQLRETPASWIKSVNPLKDQEFSCVSRRLSFFIHRPACLICLYPLSTPVYRPISRSTFVVFERTPPPSSSQRVEGIRLKRESTKPEGGCTTRMEDEEEERRKLGRTSGILISSLLFLLVHGLKRPLWWGTALWHGFVAIIPCIGRSLGIEDGGRSGREEGGMQAASRHIWFSASRKRASLGGDCEREEAVIQEAKGGHRRRRARRSGGELCFGPRTRDYCRDNEAKARFLPFQPRAAKRYLEWLIVRSLWLPGPHIVHRREVTLLRETREEPQMRPRHSDQYRA